MKNNIFKLLSKTFFVFLIISTTADSKTFKVKKLEIDLFKTDNLLESKKVLSEGFGLIKINVYAEKTENNQIGSIIKVVSTKIDKYGREVKVFLDNYLFKDPPSLFKNKVNKNFLLIDEKRNNTISVQELNLKEYLNQHDEIPEFKRTITNLKKKYNINLPERVLRSDHVYLRGNGDLVWVSHMYNYKQTISEDIFDRNNSKFDPKSINQYLEFKNYMDQWINLSLSRHNEFQNKLKIKNKLDLTYEKYDNNISLKAYKKIFHEYQFSSKNIENLEKAKKATEQKAKVEKAKKAAEQKAKEEKAKKAAKKNPVNEDNLSVEDIMAKIKDLNDMYKSGLISKDEFELLKSKLLENN